MQNNDTIAAIATPAGQGGIGIIRVSGPQASAIAKSIFQPSSHNCSWESHHLYHGDLVSSVGATILDEVLIALMRKPHSFTGEDVLEINCHGNPLLLQTILGDLIKRGCRLAKPGEFSQRAFLNNRLDLTQAEALAGLINAQSPKAGLMGLAQLKGNLSREIEEIRSLLIDVLAQLEAAIDFSEDINEDEKRPPAPGLVTVRDRLDNLLATYSSARIYTEGINVVITGRPNVGKSSLLNSLTGKKRAIVTDIPGTTRDLITDSMNIGGIAVNLVDTAGIRNPQNIIEKEGIALVWENLAQADVVIILLDGSKPLTAEDEEIIKRNSGGNIIVAINKMDLPFAWEQKELKSLPAAAKILNISAKFNRGLEELKKAIVAMVLVDQEVKAEGVMITNMRHKLALEKTKECILQAQESIDRGLSLEFSAFDLRAAIENLDEITGRKISEEVRDKIFSSFCIGK